MKRIGGNRRKSRSKLRINLKDRGKLYISKFIQELEPKTKVAFKANPTYQKGIYNLRFHGRVGEVIKKQGDCYVVSLKDGKKAKEIITHPIHLKKI